jgi:hypothetical protein
MRFLGRIREAARLQWHCEYGANIPAMMRSAQKLKDMKITADEQVLVDRVVAWMEDQVRTRDRWF